MSALTGGYTYQAAATNARTTITDTNAANLGPIPESQPPVDPQTGKIDHTWLNWLKALKLRAEAVMHIDAGTIISGVFAAAQIPQLPSTRLDMTASPRLLGRWSAGAGASEEIRLGATLRLADGILSIAGLPGGYVIGDLLYADSDHSLARLADVSVGSYLRSGGVATAPLWSTLKLPNAATTGDLLYGSSANTIGNLAAVAAGRLLRAAGVGAAPAYSTFTIPDTFAQGDLPFASASNAVTALAKDTNATRYLSNTGANNNPAWAQVNLANGVTGTLPVANGGSGTATAFTAGSVVFAGASGVYSQDNANLFWDDSNNRLGIGTASPGAPLHVLGASAGVITSKLENTTSGATAWSRFQITAGSANAFLDLYSQGYTPGSYDVAGGVAFVNQGAGGFAFAASNATGDIRFFTTGSNIERLRLHSSGGLNLGSALTSDPGANVLRVTGAEAGVATLQLYADEGDDNDDKWGVVAGTDGSLSFQNNGTRTYAAFFDARHVWYDSDGTTSAMTFDPADGTTSVLDILDSANGTGNVTGNGLRIGRNSSGNGAAGWLGLMDKNGTVNYLWVDATGVLRISSAPPDEDGVPSDTSGTPV